MFRASCQPQKRRRRLPELSIRSLVFALFFLCEKRFFTLLLPDPIASTLLHVPASEWRSVDAIGSGSRRVKNRFSQRKNNANTNERMLNSGNRRRRFWG